MIGHISENPVGKVLASICGGLMVLLVLLGVAWMLPPAGSDAGDGGSGDGMESDVPQIKPGEPIESYVVITDRPVFNESRQPIIGAAEGGEDEDELDGVEDVDAPDVELAGVVITPELRVATLRLKDSPESLMALEGQPLEGDFGSWRISRIEARSAILESGAGEQVRLDLQIHDAMIDQPPEPKTKPETRASKDGAAQDAAADDAPMSRAEEIRQRIAERREELRRAAEENEAPANPEPQMDYRKAIQNMISGRKDQEQNENDQ